ncbi:MAG: type II toxin-antitoxin system VapC family toxin [Phycisphaerales bacterium]|nr:type II toxin-antitoxin system VapC family toxin [Phycisphaerales bacterium]
MIYLLDSSACVDYLRRQNSILRRWFFTGIRPSIRLCSVVRAELLLGVEKHGTERHRWEVMEFLGLFESYPFDDAAAAIYAKIRASLEREGRVIGSNDMLIAAIAVARGATLVTGNAKEFSRIPALQCLTLENLARL